MFKKIIAALCVTTSILSASSMFSKNPVVVLETSKGNIELELYADKAPLAVSNFVQHVSTGYYNNVIFHRVIQNFMIQGGDPTGTGRGGESVFGKPFDDEFNNGYAFDKPGVLAMANSGLSTNGSQFFITTVPTPWLTNRHTIFGKVVKGMDTVSAIEKAPARDSRPTPEVKIIKTYVKVDDKK